MQRIPRSLEVLVVSATLGAATPMAAQQPTTQSVWLNVELLLPTQIRLPDGYVPGGSYPLIVGLHGFGSSTRDFMQMADYFGAAGVIFAVPQAPYALVVRDHLGFSWNPQHLGEDAPSAEATELSVQYIASLTNGLADQYRPSDLYLLGYSQGAAYALLAGSRYAHLFRGIAAIAGGLDPARLPPAPPETRYFIGHSPEDRPGSFERAEALRDTLAARGFDVTFRDYVGGHVITPELLGELFAWIRTMSP